MTDTILTDMQLSNATCSCVINAPVADNQRSLMLQFEVILGGFVGMMPVLARGRVDRGAGGRGEMKQQQYQMRVRYQELGGHSHPDIYWKTGLSVWQGWRFDDDQ